MNMFVFLGGRKTGDPGDKTSVQGELTTNVCNRAGIEPGPHRLEASVFTTTSYVRSHRTLLGYLRQNRTLSRSELQHSRGFILGITELSTSLYGH